MANILDTIVEEKRREIQLLPVGTISVEQLQLAIQSRGGIRDFAGALRRPGSQMGLIAEVKKASPSAGLIRPDFDHVRIAKFGQRRLHKNYYINESPL